MVTTQTSAPTTAQTPVVRIGQGTCTLQGQGYTIEVSELANKGPLISVRDAAGKKVGITLFELFAGKWTFPGN